MSTNLITPPQLSARIGIKETTLANWRVLGRGPRFIRVGRSIRYRSEDVEAWLSGRTADSTTDADGRGLL